MWHWKISFAITRINYILKHMKIDINIHNITVLLYFVQVNALLSSIKIFQKTLNLSNPVTLILIIVKRLVVIIKIWIIHLIRINRAVWRIMYQAWDCAQDWILIQSSLSSDSNVQCEFWAEICISVSQARHQFLPPTLCLYLPLLLALVPVPAVPQRHKGWQYWHSDWSAQAARF